MTKRLLMPLILIPVQANTEPLFHSPQTESTGLITLLWLLISAIAAFFIVLLFFSRLEVLMMRKAKRFFEDRFKTSLAHVDCVALYQKKDHLKPSLAIFHIDDNDCRALFYGNPNNIHDQTLKGLRLLPKDYQHKDTASLIDIYLTLKKLEALK